MNANIRHQDNGFSLQTILGCCDLLCKPDLLGNGHLAEFQKATQKAQPLWLALGVCHFQLWLDVQRAGLTSQRWSEVVGEKIFWKPSGIVAVALNCLHCPETRSPSFHVESLGWKVFDFYCFSACEAPKATMSNAAGWVAGSGGPIGSATERMPSLAQKHLEECATMLHSSEQCCGVN